MQWACDYILSAVVFQNSTKILDWVENRMFCVWPTFTEHCTGLALQGISSCHTRSNQNVEVIVFSTQFGHYVDRHNFSQEPLKNTWRSRDDFLECSLRDTCLLLKSAWPWRVKLWSMNRATGKQSASQYILQKFGMVKSTKIERRLEKRKGTSTKYHTTWMSSLLLHHKVSQNSVA